MRPLAYLAALLLCTATAAVAAPAPATPRLDAAARRTVLADLARQLRARYVFPDSVGRIEARVRSRLRSGAYDRASAPVDFGAAVTEDLRAFDLHFDLRFDPELARRLVAAGTDTSAVLPELPIGQDSLVALGRQNFGFRSLRLLPGNVGYLELTALHDLRIARPTAVAAMGFLAHADAVILDLRHVPGGSGNMVQFLASCFFGADSVELLTVEDRELGTTRRGWTNPSLVPVHLADLPLFVLTSGTTGSAGEALAFALQITRRATLVGERTVGAAHAGGWVPLTGGFVVFVPNARGFDPRTHRDWERSGVQPDLGVPAARALDTAHAESVRRLLATAGATPRADRLRWLMPLLERRAAGPLVLPGAVVARDTGSYERCAIRAEGNALQFVGASGIPQPLVPLTEDTFLIDDDRFAPEDQVRVRLAADDHGEVPSLELLVSDGRVLTRPRVGSRE